MNFMFSGCSSLSSLPDISKWNTNKVTGMSFMFYECENLILSKVVIEQYQNKYFYSYGSSLNNSMNEIDFL